MDERREGERGNSSVRAMVSLVSDSSESVRSAAHAALLRVGVPALTELEAAASSDDARLRVAARQLVEEVRCRALEHELRALAPRLDRDTHALEEATLLVARSQHPSLDVGWVGAGLDDLACELQRRLVGLHDPRAIAHVTVRYLADEEGFRGHRLRYYDIDLSLIDRVLETRRGVPALLAAVYDFVGRRLGIRWEGLPLPGAFLLRGGTPDVPVFLDPHEGELLTRDEQWERVESVVDRPVDRAAPAATDADVLQRMLGNLQLVHRRSGDGCGLARAQRLRSALESTSRADTT